MTHIPPPADERGGLRPSRPSPRAVVVAGDGEMREGWARSLEAAGMHVTRCAGPLGACHLRSGARCPILDEADLALYHEAVLTDAFAERIRAAAPSAMVIATRDRHLVDGAHEPALSRAIYP